MECVCLSSLVIHIFYWSVLEVADFVFLHNTKISESETVGAKTKYLTKKHNILLHNTIS